MESIERIKSGARKVTVGGAIALASFGVGNAVEASAEDCNYYPPRPNPCNTLPPESTVPPTTIPETTTPSTTVPEFIPETGSDVASSIVIATVTVLMGGAIFLTTRRRDQNSANA